MEVMFEDAGDGKLKLKADVDVDALRKQTWDKMKEGAGAMQIDTSRMRIYPGVAKVPGHPLKARFLAGGYKQGSSLNKYTQIYKSVLTPYYGNKAIIDQARKDVADDLSKVKKRGGSIALTGAKVACSFVTLITIVGSVINVKADGWQEVAAERIFAELGPPIPDTPVPSLEAAREVVRHFFAPEDLIAGGKAEQAFELPNGQVITMNDRTFQLVHSESSITSVTPYLIAEIKTFPDSTYKVALKIKSPDYTVIIKDNTELKFIIQDYWPVSGQDPYYYAEAYRRARLFNNPSNP